MNFFGKILLIFYQFISNLILPVLFVLILWRRHKGKEHRTRFLERFAFSNIKRPTNCEIFWLHAVSVGESNSAWILIEELLQSHPNLKIIFTSTTTTSAQIIDNRINSSELFRERVIHQFLPLDSSLIVRLFLRHWRPKAGIFIESEIWPNFIITARQKSIPLFLINARISRKSASRWYFLKMLGLNIFNNFSLIFAQTYHDKKLLQTLSDREINFEGNLKNHSKILDFNPQDLALLKSQIGARPIFLCASTHHGEESIIINAHHQLKQQFPNLLTIIILRHPNRANDVKIMLKNYNFAQRSQHQEITVETEIYLVDSLGEMGLFYNLANFALIGGSLIDNIGGHNPVEAIQLNCAIISGQYFANNSAIYEDLQKNNGCKIVKDENDLIAVVSDFFTEPLKISEINNNAQKIIISQQDISQKIVKKIYNKIL